MQLAHADLDEQEARAPDHGEGEEGGQPDRAAGTDAGTRGRACVGKGRSGHGPYHAAPVRQESREFGRDAERAPAATEPRPSVGLQVQRSARLASWDTLTTIANRYVDEWAALDPIGATYVGIAGHDDRLTDLSPEGFAALADLDRRTLAELDAVDPGRRGASGSPRRRCRSGSASPGAVRRRRDHQRAST